VLFRSSELRELAQRDHLTGISNRRHFFDLADEACRKAAATGAPLSLLIVDVDYFKQINDTYGHMHGDEVLKTLATVCRKALGDVDMLARLGGEEFVLLLPDADLAAATAVAERLRADIQRTPVRLHDATLYFTVSLGVAQWQTDEPVPVLMRRADEALYAAKYSGRNRTEAAAGQARWGALEPARQREQNGGIDPV
jgi:diguanylate cyclase (GGDEF)-like protein